MGFLRRLAGSASKATGTTRTEIELKVTWFEGIRDDAVLQVVGEHFRQEMLRTVRPPSPGELPEGVPPPPSGYYKAILVPEPSNQYDRNAIAVNVWAGRAWNHVGYLSRDEAVDYRPLFTHLGRTGERPAVACDAALVNERGEVGVVLHLGTPGECMAELITDKRQPADHPWQGQQIVFSGQAQTLVTGVVVDRFAQIMHARWAGCEVLPRISKKAQLVVVASPGEVTTAVSKAREYGVPTVPEVEFLKGIGLPEDAVGRELLWTRG